VNRAQLLDDALNLARAGKLEYSLALQVTEYLQHDNDYIPWAAALNAFSFLNRRLTDDQGHEDFKVHWHCTQKLLSLFPKHKLSIIYGGQYKFKVKCCNKIRYFHYGATNLLISS
jgi:hypothetical protein